jgi:hypothetical protein
VEICAPTRGCSAGRDRLGLTGEHAWIDSVRSGRNRAAIDCRIESGRASPCPRTWDAGRGSMNGNFRRANSRVTTGSRIASNPVSLCHRTWAGGRRLMAAKPPAIDSMLKPTGCRQRASACGQRASACSRRVCACKWRANSYEQRATVREHQQREKVYGRTMRGHARQPRRGAKVNLGAIAVSSATPSPADKWNPAAKPSLRDRLGLSGGKSIGRNRPAAPMRLAMAPGHALTARTQVLRLGVTEPDPMANGLVRQPNHCGEKATAPGRILSANSPRPACPESINAAPRPVRRPHFLFD